MFVERVGFVDSEMGFSERETKMCFLKALQTRPDEMATDEHRKMQFVEFVEALCRVADMKDLRVSRAEVPPFGDAAKKPTPPGAGGEMSPAERVYVVLEAHVKYVLSPDGRKPERLAIEQPLGDDAAANSADAPRASRGSRDSRDRTPTASPRPTKLRSIGRSIMALRRVSVAAPEPEPVPEPAPEPESAAHPAAGAEHGAEDDPSVTADN